MKMDALPMTTCKECGTKCIRESRKGGLKSINLDSLCQNCVDKLNYELNNQNVALLCVGKEDVKMLLENNDQLREKYPQITLRDIEEIKETMESFLFDSFWDDYHTNLEVAVEERAITKEAEYIKTIPRNELPLIMGTIYEKNKVILEQRLKR